MYNILIVDDSDIDRMMIESNLRIPGAVCIAAVNGVQAMEKLKEWPIDLVLTDLVMPRMDGLELVQAMRKEYPQIPIIVTTGLGSETIAAKALNAGAASYIPKNNLAEMLRAGVQRVLDIMKNQASSSRLHDCNKALHFELEVGNDPFKLRGLVEFTDRLLDVVSPLARNDRLRIAVAVEQGLNNALYRGNLEIDSEYKIPFAEGYSDDKHRDIVEERMRSQPFANRKIQVVIDIKPTRFAMRIRDGGKGFDSSIVGNWNNPGARGIILMKAFMDKVEYNEEGNDVQLYYSFRRDADGHPLSTATKSIAPATPALSEVRAQLKCLKTGKTYRLREHKTVIGCRSGCHIHLASSSGVAPLQCMIVSEPGNWVLLQISPQFPSLVNTQQVSGRMRLKSGDIINVGSNDFEFTLLK